MVLDAFVVSASSRDQSGNVRSRALRSQKVGTCSMNDQEKTKEQLISDLTALRQRVAALEAADREGERRFRKYFEQELIGMAAVRLDSSWLDFNDRLCEILGYSREELLQKKWSDLSHPDDAEMALDHFHQLRSGAVDHYTIDKRYVRKDGSTVYTTIAVQAFHREHGTIDCIIGLMEDITPRKQAEEALQKSEERFRSYFAQGLIGMAVTSPGKRWLEVNDRLCEILGYSREELLTIRWIDVTHPDDLDANLQQFNRMAAGESDEYVDDRRLIAKDGSLIYAAVFIRCFRGNDGRPDHFLVVIEDITDRKQCAIGPGKRTSHPETPTAIERP